MNFSLLDCEGAHLLNFSGQAWSWKVLICCEVWICVFTGAMMIWVTRDSVGDSDKVDSFYSLTRIVNFQYIDHAGFFLLFVVFTSTFLTKVINGSWYNGRKSTNLSIPSQKAFQFWRRSIYERLKLLLLSVITRQGLGFDMPWTFSQATKAFSFSVVKDRRTVTEPDAERFPPEPQVRSVWPRNPSSGPQITAPPQIIQQLHVKISCTYTIEVSRCIYRRTYNSGLCTSGL